MLWFLFALLILGIIFGQGCIKGLLSFVLGAMMLMVGCAII